MRLLGWDDFDLDCWAFYLIAEVIYQDLAPESSHSFDLVNVLKIQIVLLNKMKDLLTIQIDNNKLVQE